MENVNECVCKIHLNRNMITITLKGFQLRKQDGNDNLSTESYNEGVYCFPIFSNQFGFAQRRCHPFAIYIQIYIRLHITRKANRGFSFRVE